MLGDFIGNTPALPSPAPTSSDTFTPVTLGGQGSGHNDGHICGHDGVFAHNEHNSLSSCKYCGKKNHWFNMLGALRSIHDNMQFTHTII